MAFRPLQVENGGDDGRIVARAYLELEAAGQGLHAVVFGEDHRDDPGELLVAGPGDQAAEKFEPLLARLLTSAISRS
jgi:hypothetical protein